MKMVIAIDSFKGSLTSMQAGQAVKEAALLWDPTAQAEVFPLADGGEGTVDALCDGLHGTRRRVTVTGPLAAPVQAEYCILPHGTAVIEMAAAAGLPLVPPANRDVMATTTYGVGELILDAICQGCRQFIVGIGGSATNDGGTGMLAALGYEFLDRAGQPIPLGAGGLAHLHTISSARRIPQLQECTFRVACDVTNPLCGPAGCSAVFAPQKGAAPQSIARMDQWLAHYATLSGKEEAAKAPGAGAAGGLGFAFLAFTQATLESGIGIVLEEIGLEQAICTADLVITGEGRLDAQTVMGKAPVGVAALAKKHGKKVIAFAGCVTDDAVLCHQHGIDAFFPILRQITTLEQALAPQQAYQNLKQTAYQVFRLC